MEDAIKNFAQQFAYQPVIENEAALKKASTYIVSGMGGSHLAADLLLNYDPELDIVIHSDYGLPERPVSRLTNALFIASSYSGNTEEVIDGLEKALEKKIPAAAIATGGKLLDIAKRENLPYIELPNVGIQPRSALGYGFRGLLKLIGQDAALAASAKLATELDAEALRPQGNVMAGNLNGRVPVIYSSSRNKGVAYNWKIKFNETGKIPAFDNVVPELNHNEMTGFERKAMSARGLSEHFYFVVIKDTEDDPRVQKRMDVLAKLYADRGLHSEMIPLQGNGRLLRMFSSLVLADWAAYYTAIRYGADPDQVPMVEEFKKMIAN